MPSGGLREKNNKKELQKGEKTSPLKTSMTGRLRGQEILEIITEAIEEVKRVKKIPADKAYCGFIFPSPHKNKEQPIGDTALPISVMRNLNYPLTDDKGQPLFYAKGSKQATENRLGVEQFTPHDLRRTAATFMSKAGFMDEVIDAVLNHKKKGIIKTYNQNKYDAEKQQALEA
jgi:integrase